MAADAYKAQRPEPKTRNTVTRIGIANRDWHNLLTAADQHRQKMKKHPDTTSHIGPQTIEDIRWTETLSALQSVREGKTIPADKVFAWMESWGTEEELPKPE